MKMVGHILQSSNDTVLRPLCANAAGAEEIHIPANAGQRNTSNAISVQKLDISLLSVDRLHVLNLR